MSQKAGLHPRSGKHVLVKTMGKWIISIHHSDFLGLKKLSWKYKTADIEAATEGVL